MWQPAKAIPLRFCTLMTIMTIRCFFVGILNDNEDDIDGSSIVAVDELLSLDRISDIYQDDDRQLSRRMILAIVVPVQRWKHTILDEVWLLQNLLKIMSFSVTDVSLRETSQQSASKSSTTNYSEYFITSDTTYCRKICKITIHQSNWRYNDNNIECRSRVPSVGNYFRATATTTIGSEQQQSTVNNISSATTTMSPRCTHN